MNCFNKKKIRMKHILNIFEYYRIVNFKILTLCDKFIIIIINFSVLFKRKIISNFVFIGAKS